MDKSIKIAVILSAVDKMSQIIAGSVNRSQAKLQQLSQRSYSAGTAAAAGAAATAALLYKPIQAFAELEDAGLRLKSVLMRDGGIVPDKQFEALNRQAIALGNLLPGTTSDFQNLYATMLEQGTPAKSILDGAGKAAAYLAVQLKMPTEQAGILASRLRLQMGVADNEMMQFMDIMARIKNVGVDPTEMQYAFGRSAGAMKLLNVQGLQASKTLGTLYAMLIRGGGATGETAGTGVSRIMNELMNPNKMAKFNASARAMGLQFEFFRNGKFLGMENFVAQLTKFQGMDPEKITKVLLPLTGGEGTDNQFIAALSKMGATGFNKMSAELANQATLAQKVDLQLASLNNKWEAALGNLTNSLAAFAATFAPVLKQLSNLLGRASVVLQGFIEKHPTLTKYVGLALIGLTALFATLAAGNFIIATSVTGYGRLLAIFGSTSLIRWIPGLFSQLAAGIARIGLMFLTRGIPAMISFTATVWANAAAWMANPVTWIVLGIIAAIAALVAIGYVVYKNWDKILSWFSNQWITMKAQVSGMIAVFKLFADVLIGVGKAMIGAFTFNPAMAIAGANQVANAIGKIANGGISVAYTSAYNRTLADNGVRRNATGDLERINKPVKNASTKAPVSNTYNVNLNGVKSDDPKAFASQFQRFLKEEEEKKKRLAYQ